MHFKLVTLVVVDNEGYGERWNVEIPDHSDSSLTHLIQRGVGVSDDWVECSQCGCVIHADYSFTNGNGEDDRCSKCVPSNYVHG